jgi:hypothetical protein
MKKNYTHWAIVIDRSGSMQSLKSATIEGFNQMVEDQKKEPGELTVSLIQFDSNYESPTHFGARGVQNLRYEQTNDFSLLNEVKLLNNENYVPNGGTPLNDAVARLITETGKRLAAMPESDRPEKVIVTIMTDGEENSSREHTTESVRKLIEHQEKKYGWKFIYIGANQDAFKEASTRGMSASLNFAATDKGTKSAYFASSTTLSKMRGISVDDLVTYDASVDLGATYKMEMAKPDEPKVGDTIKPKKEDKK